ncbi:MAG: MFS transporter [Gammaproteobacteria bacterium]|nr:MFS transporter [Gammaproteobacteria bacterium]
MIHSDTARHVLAATSPAAPAGPYFYGYNIIAASCILQMMYLGTLFSYGVLFPELEAEFGWSRATISGASSLSFLLMGGLAIFMGRINDVLGPRILLAVTGALFGLGYLMMFRMQSVWELYLYFGLLIGIGMGAHDVGTLSTAARWFSTRRGVMSGVVKAGAGVGQLTVPLIAAALVSAFDWRTTCIIIGGTVMVGTVIAAQVMRRDPAVMGLKPYGADQISSALGANHGATLREALRTRTFWLLCLAKFADLFCLFTVIVHIVPYSIDKGLPASTAAQVLATIGGVSIVGRLAIGAAYDRFGAKRSLMFCFALLFASLVLLQLIGDRTWTLFLFGSIYGIAHGGFFTVASPSVAEYFGTKAHGAILGAVFLSGSVGGTFGPLLAGGLFDKTGSYGVSFLVLSGFAFLGLVTAAVLPRIIRPAR